MVNKMKKNWLIWKIGLFLTLHQPNLKLNFFFHLQLSSFIGFVFLILALPLFPLLFHHRGSASLFSSSTHYLSFVTSCCFTGMFHWQEEWRFRQHSSSFSQQPLLFWFVVFYQKNVQDVDKESGWEKIELGFLSLFCAIGRREFDSVFRANTRWGTDTTLCIYWSV